MVLFSFLLSVDVLCGLVLKHVCFSCSWFCFLIVVYVWLIWWIDGFVGLVVCRVGGVLIMRWVWVLVGFVGFGGCFVDCRCDVLLR